MATHELTSRGAPAWLAKWWLPFLCITLTPAVTVPVSAILFDLLAGNRAPQDVGLPDSACSPDNWFCYTEFAEVKGTLLAFALPGLLNLVPLAWMLSKTPRVRLAGTVAGLIGIVRVSIPLLVLASFEVVSDQGGTPYFEFRQSLGPESPHAQIWLLGGMAWLGSLVVWALFGPLSRGFALGKEGV